MVIIRTKLSIARLTDSNFLIFARHAAQETTACGYFTGAAARVTAVTAKATAFENAILKAQKGGEGTVANRRVARAELETEVRLLASYIEDNCGGDPNKILATGFELRDFAPTKNKTLGVISNFLAKQLGNGRFKLSFMGGENRLLAQAQYRIVGELEWLETDVFFSDKTIELGGFTAGSNYEFRVRCIGKNPKAAKSLPSAWLSVTAYAI